MTKSLGLVCIIMLALGAEASARCSVPIIATLGNQTVDGHMTVSSGDRCSIRMRHSAGPMHSAEIVQRPSNGTVVIEPPHRIVYRSRPGYVGNDSFTYARRGMDTRNNPSVRTVRISVRVTAR
jgi:Bacterial Ig domain